jgi:dienelactone hydrolase
MQKLHVIYVPGLGDKKVSGQQKAVRTWRWWGVEPELFQMNWGDKEPWQPKFDRLLARIDALSKQGKSVGLVGASAGASAVINAYAARTSQLVGVVCIAGKINRPETIGDRYRRNNISFVTSAYDCEQALQTLQADDRRHILSRFALLDETVMKADSRVPGVHNRLSPTVGHVVTIAAQLIFGAPSFLRFLKRQANVPHRNLG